MATNMANGTSPQHAPRAWKRPAIIGALLLALVGVGVLYSHREALVGRFLNSHFVGGDPGAANVRLPAGFHATIFASGLQAPRLLSPGPDGALLVAERGAGRVVALLDPDASGKATRTVVVADGLDDPTSVDYAQGAVYVGEASRVTRLTLGPDLRATSREVVIPHLATGGIHTTRTVLVGPDGRIYVASGSTCNNCVESDPRRAAVWVYAPDGSGGRLYARGLRNAVGMAINPWNQQVWVTNNGRDLLGDNTPPETIYALRDGGNYGWPRCQAGDLIDPDLGHSGDCDGVVPPLIKMQAHSAPLGLAFYTGTRFPKEYRGLFVAFHGSWNRSVPTGYKVVYIPLDAHGQINGPAQDFATGWLADDNTARGRPVGVAVGQDGALYVSDDKGGMIYRITYRG